MLMVDFVGVVRGFHDLTFFFFRNNASPVRTQYKTLSHPYKQGWAVKNF